MTAKELIAMLAKMPPDARVFHLWDGGLGTEIEHVWLTRSGNVGTGDNDHVCYETEDRPVDAPTAEEDRYWHTPDQPSCEPRK